MGFLSRKNKSAPVPTAEETHPIVEELREMEDAVPETRQAAGPVAEGAPPAHPPEVQPSTPPTAEAPAKEPVLSEPIAEEEEPERFMPRDLIAPSRHEAVVEEPV